MFLVRKGNPKHIRDWNDVAKPGIGVIAPNPKTSGAARWNVLAAYSSGSSATTTTKRKRARCSARSTKNALVLDSASRASTVTFTERGLGDVLVSWENEAILALKQHPGEYQIVVPSVSILAEPPVAWVDTNVAKHHTEAVAKAYLHYLYSPARRSSNASGAIARGSPRCSAPAARPFARTDLTTIANFGGWNAAAQRSSPTAAFSIRRTERDDSRTRGGAWDDHARRGRRRRGAARCADPHAQRHHAGGLRCNGIFAERSLAAYRLSFGAAILASLIDIVAAGSSPSCWCVIRRPACASSMRCRRSVCVAAAVTGITLATLYGPHGWVGSRLAQHGIAVAYTPAGIVLALAFVGMPFVVRTVQPVIAALPRQYAQAAASLGATPFTVLRRITLPLVLPAFLTGFALALARARSANTDR